MKSSQVLVDINQKLNIPKSEYSDDEINWLIEHIGDPDSNIRDALVCNTFGSGFFEEKFTREQARFLFETVKQKNLLFYQISEALPATLTRSFTCLLLQLIIQTNGDKDSKYFKILDSSDEQFVVNSLVEYLNQEHNYTGFDGKYGWVHAVAHCSDALEACVKQGLFNQDLTHKLLVSSNHLFRQVNKRFVDEEEYHLADVFLACMKQNGLNNSDLLEWFASFDFDPESSDQVEFYRFGNLKSFAEDIYTKLNAINLLDDNLKKYIEKEFSQKY